ncbi:unnamed protein product [Cuscuta epithymum]|uniref:Uncharacterized protein n=1 Tax=Cuscuta epithymum TaxID=186058 RepID=A0AAV0E0E3_9ASTE|nr:unnamed protein product [Cuscuta epithymum]
MCCLIGGSKGFRRNSNIFRVWRMKKNLQLKAKDAETSRNQADLENKDHLLKKIEKDIIELKVALEQLQNGRNKLHSRLEMAAKQDSPKFFSGVEGRCPYCPPLGLAMD